VIENRPQVLLLEGLVNFKTGKLNSNAAKPDGMFPFFTCSQETFRTDTWSFDGEYVLLAGNNAAGIYPLKYFNGKFDAYQRTYAINTRDENVLATRYVYYALRLQLELMKNISTGVATKFLTLSLLNRTQIPVPSLPIQRKIAATLSAYDDLIENNLRRINILEEMAQNLYREWFVNFRFPGHQHARFTDSSRGRIPEGWEMSVLGEHLVALESGKRPKGGAKGLAFGVPSVGAENIFGIGRHKYHSEKYVSRDFFEGMRQGIVKDGDVALYKDGAYIGRSTYFRNSFPHAQFCVNEHVFLLRSTGKRLTQNMLYLWLQEPATVSAIRATNANAAQPGINQTGVNGVSLIVPPLDIAGRFDQLAEPSLALIISLAKRNGTLCRTRDLLLPRLISGEVDVSTLDIAVPEEASA
jgi:type I restriction enzyme S subunit